MVPVRVTRCICEKNAPKCPKKWKKCSKTFFYRNWCINVTV
jgi:hypothetical protein